MTGSAFFCQMMKALPERDPAKQKKWALCSDRLTVSLPLWQIDLQEV